MSDKSQAEIPMEELARLFARHMPHGQDIGMQMDGSSADGRTRMHLPAQPFLSGDATASFFFPGVLFSMADTACGMAVFRALGRYTPIATIDMRIDHLAPATMDADLLAVAECYRMTRSIAFARCELLCGPRSKVVAIAVGTFMLQSRSTRMAGIHKPQGRPQ